jgi:predicted dehydrogenase
VVHTIAGHITDVETVEGWCKDYDVCDNMTAKIRVGEIPVDAYLSWTKIRPRFSISVDFENGRLYTDLMINPYKLEVSIKGIQKTIKEKGMGWYLDLIKFKHPSFKNQYNHFLNLIQGTGKPKITIDDEINILDTIVKVSEKMEF